MKNNALKKVGLSIFMLLFFLIFIVSQVDADTVITSDLNKDGKPDAWSYIKGKVVTRQELDVNFDGKVDSIYIYDSKGKVKEEILDTNYDGKMDNWRFYDNGSLTLDEADSNYDGKIDLWIFVDRDRVYKIEKDTNGDGKPDKIINY